MAKFLITAPQAVTTKVAGVTLVDGKATVDDATQDSRRALAYFRRKSYQVEPVDEAQPEPAATQEPEPVITEPPARGATKDAWIAFVTSEAAGEKRLTLDEATALKRDELAEHVLGPKED
jgi:hypothetical protein